MRLSSRLLFFILITLVCVPLLAQQTGSASGKVTADGAPLPGVTVEARSDVLPQPRVTVTDSNGAYQLPALQPGTYTLTFTLAGLQTVTRRAEVLLSQNTTADVTMGVQGLSENITVTAEATLVDRESTAISSALSQEQISALPVGQQYRDLVKLIPGVQQTNEAVRGPSGGGSGQDNVYLLDGVNITKPLYGTLSAEPSSYDISQVSVIKGGAKAVDFDRSGGFTIDSISKSGTNKITGQVSYQIQNHSMTSTQKVSAGGTFDQDQNWASVGLGGPIMPDRLFFYGSYYRPTTTRSNQANVYGPLPKYDSSRNEGFGKLTFTPTSNFLINGSYRGSKRDDSAGAVFPSTSAGTTGSGSNTKLTIGTLEGSWIVNTKSFATAKFTNFVERNHSVPDFPLGITPSTTVGTHIDFNNLDQLGGVNVPKLGSNQTANTFLDQFIQKYGYLQNGVRVGGGTVGVSATGLDQDDFFRKSGQVGYNMNLGSSITHDLHAGYQRYVDTEELQRLSNGWGTFDIVGGSVNCPTNACGAGTAIPYYVRATYLQATLGSTPVRKIHAEYHSQSVELNDTIRWNNWAFNAGVIASNDTLYGQGLKNDSSTISGYTLAPGTKYKMYNIPFSKMIQPRLGATWTYNGQDTVYASVAKYNPAASSLPRAASFDRNYTVRNLIGYFDQNGNLMGTSPLASSSGKLFVPDMTPRTTMEYLFGSAQQLTNRWSSRIYGRYRKSNHFWEDTNNTARADYNAPAGISHDPYIPTLNDQRLQIGNGNRSNGGSSYVIAELDGAFTKYYEATLESDWRGGKTFLRGSYTWSHYYGNFDQDNTAGFADNFNDMNAFIGSSNLADGPGKQIWDMKYGDLHGDRRHLLKLFGSYSLPWNATTGAYGVYQSGQPWEVWDYTRYSQFPDNSTSETIKFAEPAGSRKTPAHYQLDLDYTQNFPIRGLNLQLVGDVFNVFNKQTGYYYQPATHSALFGQPLRYWQARRFQVAARVQF